MRAGGCIVAGGLHTHNDPSPSILDKGLEYMAVSYCASLNACMTFCDDGTISANQELTSSLKTDATTSLKASAL